MPLRAANSRKLKPAASRFCLTARPTRRLTSSSNVDKVPAGCMHAEHVGPEGVALMSGRRRNGGPLSREAFESDLRREGFDVVNGGQQPDFAEDMHAHDFDVKIMVLAGEITVTRDGKADVFHAGDHCEIPAVCQYTTKVGPEGVAYIVGKACRRPTLN